jgi:hypothetical protein
MTRGFYHSRYIANSSSSQILGLGEYIYDQEQMSASSQNDNMIQILELVPNPYLQISSVFLLSNLMPGQLRPFTPLLALSLVNLKAKPQRGSSSPIITSQCLYGHIND